MSRAGTALELSENYELKPAAFSTHWKLTISSMQMNSFNFEVANNQILHVTLLLGAATILRPTFNYGRQWEHLTDVKPHRRPTNTLESELVSSGWEFR